MQQQHDMSQNMLTNEVFFNGPTNTRSSKGFSTLEMMMAMAIISIVLSAVVVTAFGNQSTLVGSQTNSEAMNIAQQLLETEQALARKDFNMVNETTTSDGFYTGTVTVSNAPTGDAQHPYDYFTKSVKASVSWKDERGITRSVDLTTLVSNFGNTAGGNTCNSSLSGNWNPPATHIYTLQSLAGLAPASYGITGIDAYLDRLYVTAGPTVGTTDKTFFVFNLSGGIPSFAGALDTSGSSVKSPNALAVVATTTAASGRVYAYLANEVNPDWSSSASCATASASCSQLQVVDVTNPASPAIVTNFKFATSTFSVPGSPPYVTGSGGQAVGKSLFYRNGYLFLGLSKTGSGPEFHIIDVHNPLSPQPIGNFSVGRSVEAITVRGNFAYLATDDNASDNILTILDISDPTNPKKVWPGVIATGIGFGRSLALIEDTLHFVKTADSSKPEWYLLDNPTPAAAAPTPLATLDLGNSTSINNILIRDYLAFMTTSPAGQILIRNATSTAQYASAIVLPGPGSALDCEGNFVYAGSADAAGTITVLGQ